MKITVTGIDEVIKDLEERGKKQVLFATAKALTLTAKDIQTAIVNELPGRFTLRTGWWKPSNKMGFRIKAARKDNLTAEIYTDAPWMSLHETGGVKSPRGGSIAIPTENVRRTKRDLVAKSNKPRNITNSFIGTTRSGQRALFKRVKEGKSVRLKVMYILEASANIKERLSMYATALKVFNEKFSNNFYKALNDALKTSK